MLGKGTSAVAGAMLAVCSVYQLWSYHRAASQHLSLNIRLFGQITLMVEREIINTEDAFNDALISALTESKHAYSKLPYVARMIYRYRYRDVYDNVHNPKMFEEDRAAQTFQPELTDGVDMEVQASINALSDIAKLSMNYDSFEDSLEPSRPVDSTPAGSSENL